ncbi:MAG: PEP-CTERM sorting domain-containing protein [Phycisphaerae bacterium]
MQSTHLVIAAVIAAAASLPAAQAATAPFTPGDLLVYRDVTSNFITPTGAPAVQPGLNSTGNEVFLDEYSPLGVYQGSLDTGLVDPGNSSSHGLMNISPDGKYLAVPGYASYASGGINSTTADVDARVVKVYNTADGSLVGTVNFTDSSITSDYRSAVTDGTNVWVSGASTTGIRTNTIVSPASSTSNILGTTSNNYRGLQIAGGQLYLSTSNSEKLDIVGTSSASDPISTATGQSLFPQALSLAPSTSISPFQFALFSLGGTGDIDTLYMSDDASATRGIRKFSLVSGVWVENGDFQADPSVAIRGLAGVKNNDGSVTLYATLPPTSASATNVSTVYSYTDSTGFSGSTTGLTGTLSPLATIQTVADAVDPNAVTGSYHGIVVLPGAVPEPASLGLLAVGAAGLLTRRRK